jgi:small subunit ribosomal protein S20
MANLKSSKKDMRRIAKRTARNRSVKTKLNTLSRRVSELRAANADGSILRETACCYLSSLDKAVKHGIIHRNRSQRVKKALSPIVFGSQLASQSEVETNGEAAPAEIVA